MPIESVCLNCGATMRVGVKAIGKTLPCRECGNGIYIEDPTKQKPKGSSPAATRGVSTQVARETTGSHSALSLQVGLLRLIGWVNLLVGIGLAIYVPIQFVQLKMPLMAATASGISVERAKELPW